MTKLKEKKIARTFYELETLFDDFNDACDARGEKRSVVHARLLKGFVDENKELVAKWKFKNALTNLIDASDIDKASMEKFFKSGISKKDISKMWEGVMEGVDMTTAKKIIKEWLGEKTIMPDVQMPGVLDERKQKKKFKPPNQEE